MTNLPCNVGGRDKDFRMVIGVATAVVALVSDLSGPTRASAALVSVIALGTAISGYCPLNQMLGVDTCEPLQS